MKMNEFSIAIKPRRPGGSTSLGLLKDQPMQSPGKTRSTHDLDEIRVFFFKCGFSSILLFFIFF